MATSPGQRFVRRQNAARSSTANATAADITYDTAVLSEGGYSYSSPEVTVDEAGLYLNIFDLGQVSLASTRSVGTLVPSVNATDQTRFRATHRYLRNSGGANEGASIGMAILDLAANDDVKVRNPGVLTPTDSLGNYATLVNFGGALQLIRLPDGNFTHVERTVDAAEVGTSNINTTRPWLDSSGTWTTVTFNSEVRDDDSLYSGSGGDLTLAANKKYMVVWGATCYSTDASRHAYVTRLQINGNHVQSGSGYPRNTASQGPPICGMYLHETGGSAETLRIQATHETEGGDAGTPQVADAYVQVLELPSSAEWIHVDNGATDSMTTTLASILAAYDTPLSSTLRADGNSDLSLDAANDAVQNDSGGSLPVLAVGWHRWDRDSGSSGLRKAPWSAWSNDGTFLGYGVAGAYSRGQQSSDDTFQAHYCAAATMDMADGTDLKFAAGDPASSSNADMGIYASTSRYFLGVQVLNLNSLDAGPGAVTGDADFALDDATISSDGDVEIQAEASNTLGDATISSDGEVLVQADSDFTLGDATISSDASVISGVEADAAFTLDDAGVSSDASVLVQGNSAFTLDDVVVDSDASVLAVVLGDANFTLDDFSVSSEGDVDIQATAAFTLDDYTLGSDSSVDAQGDSSFTLDDITIDADGSVISGIAANANFTLGDAVISSDVVTDIAGDGALSLDDFTIDSDVAVDIQADSAFSLDDLSIGSDVGVLIQADSSFTLDDLTILAESGAAATADASFALDDLSLLSDVSLFIEADANYQLDDVTISSDGSIISGSTANLDVTLDDVTISGQVSLSGFGTGRGSGRKFY